MASCKNCGVEIKEGTDFCPNCDNGVNDVTDKQQSTIIDKGGFGWGLLGCFIVGVILYLVWSDERPKTARAVGIGAITCVAIVIVCYLLIMLVGMIVNPYGNVVV